MQKIKKQYKVNRGDSFGHLTVVGEGEYHPDKSHKNRRFWCRCGCGWEGYKWQATLTSGRLVSCGKCHLVRRGRLPLPFGEAARNQAYSSHVNQARGRGMTPLDKETFLAMSQEPCHYCGRSKTSLVNPVRSNGTKAGLSMYNGGFSYNGVDRLESKDGYVPGNIVPCCGMCNRAKYDGPPEMMREYAWHLFNHQFPEESARLRLTVGKHKSPDALAA